MKTALVLSGGGAKGSIQFGILKYLHEQGLRPNVIYGTSVGSLNAAGYTYKGIEGLEKIWASITSKSSVFKFNWKSLILRATGLYHAKPLKELLEKSIQGTPNCDAYSCAVNLNTGDIKYFHNLESDYLNGTLASASIPVLCEAINGWVDGGAREQTPLKRAIRDGAEKIVVILCNPITQNPDPDNNIHNCIQSLLRTTDILAHEIFLNDIQNCLWYNENKVIGKRKIQLEIYAPKVLNLSTSDFIQEKIQPAIQYGYEIAKSGPVDLDFIKSL